MISYEGGQNANKKELIVAGILTALLAFMDISGLPCFRYQPIYYCADLYIARDI